MKVTVDSKKGLKTNLKVFVDKRTIDEKIGVRLTELSKTVNLKGFFFQQRLLNLFLILFWNLL